MVRNLAIGTKGPQRNLFPFASQMQTTGFYGNFGHAVDQEGGSWDSCPSWNLPYLLVCMLLYGPQCNSLRRLNRQGLSWPLCDIAYIVSERNAGQEALRTTGFHDGMSGKVP